MEIKELKTELDASILNFHELNMLYFLYLSIILIEWDLIYLL